MIINYKEEFVDVYMIAIEALRMHESDSDIKISKEFREIFAKGLEVQLRKKLIKLEIAEGKLKNKSASLEK